MAGWLLLGIKVVRCVRTVRYGTKIAAYYLHAPQRTAEIRPFYAKRWISYQIRSRTKNGHGNVMDRFRHSFPK